MFIEKEYLDRWFQKIMERFDRLENSLIKPPPEREQFGMKINKKHSCCHYFYTFAPY
jgi:hypothetical protein